MVGYIPELTNIDALALAQVAHNIGHYEAAFGLFRKGGNNVQAVMVLLKVYSYSHILVYE